MRIATLVTTAILAAFAVSAEAQEDAVGVPGPIAFEGTAFELVWTSNPSPTYFKQEYLPADEALEDYSEMFIVEVLTEGATPSSAAASMVASLDQRRASDPVVNYDIIANEATGELFLDFLLSDDSTGTLIVEWNAYRYVPLGEDGIALYAISRRGYDDDASAFIVRLADWRQSTIFALADLAVPEIALD